MMFGDGGLKGRVQLAEAMLEDVGEADQDGQIDAAQHQRVDQFLEVDRARRVLFRVHQHVAIVADRKVALAPARHVIKVAGDLRRPSFSGLDHDGALTAISIQLGNLSLNHQCPSKASGVARKNCMVMRNGSKIVAMWSQSSIRWAQGSPKRPSGSLRFPRRLAAHQPA